MSDDATLRLRITVDGANAIPDAMKQAAAAVTQSSEQIASDFSKGLTSAANDAKFFASSMTPAMKETEYSVGEARHAMALLGEQIGVRLPGQIGKLVAEVPAIGSAMSAAFSAIAVVGLIQVLLEVPEAFDKITASVTGWDDTAKKAYDHQIEINQQYLDLINQTIQAQRELALVGKTGSEEKRIALDIERASQADNIAALHDGQVKVAADMKTLADLEEKSGFQLRDLLNPGMRLFANHVAGTSEEMKRLQKEIETTTEKNIALDIAIKKSQQIAQPKAKAEQSDAEKQEAKKIADEKLAIEKRFKDATQEVNLKRQQELLESIQKVNAAEEAAEAERLKRGFAAVEESGRIIQQYNEQQRAKEKQETAELLRFIDKARADEIQSEMQRRENLDRQRMQDWQEEQAQLRAQQKWINQYLKGIDSQFNQHVMAWVQGQETIKGALEQSWNAIASNAIQNLALMAEKELLYHVMHIEREKKGILVDAKRAASSGYTAVMKALPFPADVIVAPIVAAAAFAGVAAFGSFDQGGIVPNTGMHMLHAKEMVLPADISAGLQNAFNGGGKVQRGGDVVLHYTAQGAGSPADHKRNAAEIVKIIKREQRRGALPSA